MLFRDVSVLPRFLIVKRCNSSAKKLFERYYDEIITMTSLLFGSSFFFLSFTPNNFRFSAPFTCSANFGMIMRDFYSAFCRYLTHHGSLMHLTMQLQPIWMC